MKMKRIRTSIDNVFSVKISENEKKYFQLEPVKISQRWYVWHIGDDDFKYVGKLRGKNRESEIGMVMTPYDIVDRIKTGKYNFYYPSFE